MTQIIVQCVVQISVLSVALRNAICIAARVCVEVEYIGCREEEINQGTSQLHCQAEEDSWRQQ